MAFQLTRSIDATKPALVLTVYGVGGVGKTSLATTAPKPVFIDAENGTKALGIRGIDVPIAHVRSWTDVQDAWIMIAANPDFETVVIDPVGQFLELLIEEVRAGGTMSQQKWGEAKDRMRRFIAKVKDSGKHVVFVAHEDKDKDEDLQLRRPLLAANLSQPLVDMSDVVGNLRVDTAGKRTLQVQPEPKFVAKDRYGVLGARIEVPDQETEKGKQVIIDMIASIHDAYNADPIAMLTPKEPRKKAKDEEPPEVLK